MADKLVMIVDDDDEIRDALEDVLGGEGYRVVGARDGRQALDFIQAGSLPSAIVLDLWMPVMDGWQLRKELLSNESLAKIPVIVLTAAHDQRAPQLGVSGILTKPVDLRKLLHALGEAGVSH
jgi:CheY-like chemotaxis protein